jgi:proton-dependent oligopeptide transporter, POT family
MNQEIKKTGHPRGLYVLFFTEMWERFGYYLMLGIFSLYMLDSVDNGGMGFTAQKKSDIYGTYLGLVYLTPFLGGLIADRLLGYRKSIIIGAALMAAGYLGLAVPGTTFFYLSLLAIILGNGFFKPNISTLVGNLYNNDKYRSKKDAGYNIFYMGINIGAFVCNFVAAYMRNNYGWGYAFAAAGVGMLIGLVWFMGGMKHVKDVDVIKPTNKEDLSLTKIFGFVFLPVFAFGVIGYFLKGVTGADNPDGNVFGTDSNDAFLFGCIPVVLFYGSLWWRANIEDKRPIGALLAVFAAVIVFWAIFHQNGDALTVWAEEYTDRVIENEAAETAFDALALTQTVTYDSLAPNAYFKGVPSADLPEQGSTLKLYSTELYQSINPFWVVLLTPIVVGFFGWMRSRKMEPSTPAKIVLGLFITALSALVMVAAVKTTDFSLGKASNFWLWSTYGVITVGELCLSPMGLSLVSKLSPTRLTSLMMGGWFLSTSVGNKLSGVLSGMWERYEDKSQFFLLNFALAIVAFLVLLSMLRWLNRVMKEKGVF